MPIRIPDNLPAREVLKEEHVFFMGESRADHQDIRPMEVIILNLMPDKVRTETQIIRTLSYTPLQVNVTLLHTGSYQSKNTPPEHFKAFYHTFEEIKDKRFDALIVTGAPVELMDFEEVEYWPELQNVFEWSKTHVYSSLFICWGAQAALHHFHDVPKYELPQKRFGVFAHDTVTPRHPLLRGFDDQFYVPVSRHTEIREEDIQNIEGVNVLARSEQSGLYLLHEEKCNRLYLFNHPEYDPNTLKEEYERDVKAGKPIDLPVNYFKDDNPDNEPNVLWRSHRNLLFSNWLNSVYQGTPYNLDDLSTFCP